MLERILEKKKEETKNLPGRDSDLKPDRQFLQALRNPARKTAVIAEIKKASPSRGIIMESFDPVRIGREYEKAGADALSILTDETFFQGHPRFIREVKAHTSLPVLRKDFVIDARQIEESISLGADAILLIAAALTPEKLAELYFRAKQRGLDVLVEVHSEEELRGVLSVCTPDLIGVNNRDLNTFRTSLSFTEKIAPLIPENSLFVSESGIHTPEDVKRVVRAGASGMLIGESLMRADCKEEKMNRLFSGGEE
ncbi:indole-3-glycerol phosphate synthase TrpC [Alteribacter natronophilus]|uniref:indole-3-glycerol phosphate synthase TrpC n=1 Tax=Alteribacter natronophilus TaxID=2583810 RepID=UPI0014862933|nr:indole-3-glycerol phosphate synthase TrpC [Alteribacter natronophilus]